MVRQRLKRTVGGIKEDEERMRSKEQNYKVKEG